MDKTPAYYIFLGLLIGAAFGILAGAISGNPISGMQLGAMAGMFVGWILAASILGH